MSLRGWVWAVAFASAVVEGQGAAFAYGGDGGTEPVDLGTTDAAGIPTDGGLAPVPEPPATAPPIVVVPPPVIAPAKPSKDALSQTDSMVQFRLLQDRVYRDHSRRVRNATRGRNSGIAVTSIGLAFEIAGIVLLDTGIRKGGPHAYDVFIDTNSVGLNDGGHGGVGTAAFNEAMAGIALSFVGLIMWPTGTSQWVREQRELNVLHHDGLEELSRPAPIAPGVR